jgi:GH15 family glucan-1,4-alpha-glucosidase
MSQQAKYNAIEDYGIIGDMHTAALVGKDGGIDFLCWPVFDSPSIFCRLLDKHKGGHFSLQGRPSNDILPITKQRYLPYTNLLETKFIHEDGNLTVMDFFPVQGAWRQSMENWSSSLRYYSKG